MTLLEAAQAVVDRWDGSIAIGFRNQWVEPYIEALRTALVQPEQCPTCGEDEPYTESCDTSDNDTKALCKRTNPPPSAEPTIKQNLTVAQPDSESSDREALIAALRLRGGDFNVPYERRHLRKLMDEAADMLAADAQRQAGAALSIEAYQKQVDDLAQQVAVPPAGCWPGLNHVRGVRVQNDTVVLSMWGGNDAARRLCGEILTWKNGAGK